jgi:hypothetical protein
MSAADVDSLVPPADAEINPWGDPALDWTAR